MWVTIRVDVVQAEKRWKALVTSNVVLGKAEAEAMAMASMEFLMMTAPTVALASQTPSQKMHRFAAKCRGLHCYLREAGSMHRSSCLSGSNTMLQSGRVHMPHQLD